MAGRTALLPCLALCLVLLPGCGWLLRPAVVGGTSGASSDEAAAANVRSAIPAVETYYVESGSYTGATVARLQEYDHGVADVRIVVDPGGRGYCIESTVGAVTASRPGPAGDFRPAGC